MAAAGELHITEAQADEYAIGALEPEIAALITLHAEECDECRALVAASQAVAATLGMGVPMRSAPPKVKRKVMHSAGIRRFRPLWIVAKFTPAAIGAAAIIVAFAAFTGMVSLRSQVSTLRDQNAKLDTQIDEALSQKIEIAALTQRLDASEENADILSTQAKSDRDLLVALLSPDSEVAELVPLDDGIAAVGRLVWDKQQQRVWFVATRLPPRAQDETYHIWVYSNGQYVSIGTFNPDENGFARFSTYLPQGLTAYESAVITIEKTGEAERKGPSVFVSDLSNVSGR